MIEKKSGYIWVSWDLVIERCFMYHHGQAVRHGNEVGTSMFRPSLIKVVSGCQGRSLQALEIIFIIFKTKLPRIFANDLDILPTKSGKTLAGHFTKGRREVNKVDAGEELRNVDKFGHCLNVPTSTSTHLGLLLA